MRTRRRFALTVAALALSLYVSVSAAAHRLDEYLQAARVSLLVNAVVVELNLTPGVAVAPSVVAAIDGDRDGRFSDVEQQTYADRLRSDLHLAIDGVALPAELTRIEYPTLEQLTDGVGVIRIELRSTFSTSTAGHHEFSLRNDHRPEVGVYLANALVPMTAAIAIRDQRRDLDQRELRIEYDVTPGGTSPIVFIVAALVALVGLAGILRFRRA